MLKGEHLQCMLEVSLPVPMPSQVLYICPGAHVGKGECICALHIQTCLLSCAHAAFYLMQVSLEVDYEIDRDRVQAGVSRLYQLVNSGVWRATLIQRDHPSTLPPTATIIINV